MCFWLGVFARSLNHSLLLLLCAGIVVLSARSVRGDDVATPWESAYEGSDATGPQVLGFWKFDTDDGSDAAGRLPKGVLQNGKLVPAGKFGGALESFAGFPDDDRSHGFIVPSSP
ncbi:MAG: hypothetical protein ACK58T_49755, partial [Phycisphaerae bacterium]